MNNTTALFIRACKPKNPLKRCLSVYKKRIDRTVTEMPYYEISIILSNICDQQLNSMSHSDCFTMITKLKGKDVIKEYCEYCIIKIRHAPLDAFKDPLPLPVIFKRGES